MRPRFAVGRCGWYYSLNKHIGSSRMPSTITGSIMTKFHNALKTIRYYCLGRLGAGRSKPSLLLPKCFRARFQHPRKRTPAWKTPLWRTGAGEGVRTLYFNLGKTRLRNCDGTPDYTKIRYLVVRWRVILRCITFSYATAFDQMPLMCFRECAICFRRKLGTFQGRGAKPLECRAVGLGTYPSNQTSSGKPCADIMLTQQPERPWKHDSFSILAWRAEVSKRLSPA
jgi:hypothetical protein